ncbi:MAG: hypothetical protein MJ060_00785 [Clostridia bacterium]|nr:hypothetical protein [Clostridia bacterium]
MHQLFDELYDSMPPTFVIDFLQEIMRREITNRVRRRDNELLVSLTNHTKARITAPQVAYDTQPPQQTEARIHNIATLRYIFEHNYGYSEDFMHRTINKLKLHNLDECQTYLEDVVSSQLNAYFTNNLIEFITNGAKFLLTIELKQ